MGDFDHPFVTKLYATFKTQRSVYMLLELSLGGELFTHIKEVHVLDEPASRFYMGCIVLALEYLHAQHIIYRDLKPENVVINANGYIKLVDLGFAKKIHLRTYTLCGTPEYLSPEQITLRGHGRGVDWWASGVFLYELLVGFTPFCFENKDLNPTIIYQNILNPKYEIEYPSRLSSEVVHLVSSLLRSKPMERVGCLSGGPADIRKHVFFQKDDFDWGKLLRLELPPPYVPKIKSETDVSNFDRIESKVDFFAGEPYDFSDARQWDVDF